MTDTKLIKLEKEIQKKITITQKTTTKKTTRFDFDRAKNLAKVLNNIEAQSHATAV